MQKNPIHEGHPIRRLAVDSGFSYEAEVFREPTRDLQRSADESLSPLANYAAWASDLAARYKASTSRFAHPEFGEEEPENNPFWLWAKIFTQEWMQRYLSRPEVSRAIQNIARKASEIIPTTHEPIPTPVISSPPKERIPRSSVRNWVQYCEALCVVIGSYAERDDDYRRRLARVRLLLSKRKRATISAALTRCADYFEEFNALGFNLSEETSEDARVTHQWRLLPSNRDIVLLRRRAKSLTELEPTIFIRGVIPLGPDKAGRSKNYMYDECLRFVSGAMQKFIGAPMDKDVAVLMNAAFNLNIDPNTTRSIAKRRERAKRTITHR